MARGNKFKFPARFLWGVATSAHQTEGGQHNQWSVWELENAKALSAKASYQYDDLESWQLIKNEALTPANYISGKATNYYQNYKEDIALVKKLNMNAFRLSIEWSRVQPRVDVWNAEAILHYKSVLQEMKNQGIEPIVTLFHFTLPIWFTDLGGFEKYQNVKYFVEFAERIIKELGGVVKYIITVNEPEVYAYESYYLGNWPPQISSKLAFLKVYNNLTAAHNRVAKILHNSSRRYKISIAKNCINFYPGDDSWLSVRSASIAQYLTDDYFLKRVIKQCDFIGVNYYLSARIYGYRTHSPEQLVNDLGWTMEPEHIGHVIERLNEKYNKPIFITENGLADASDKYREWWLKKTIFALNESIKKGIPVIGYLHWSLTDNFEWDKGFWPRFGLFSVDYKTLRRTPRKSAVWFAKFLRELK